MKRTLKTTAVLLMLSILLSLSACVTEQNSTTNPTTVTTTPPTTAAPTTEAPNEGLILYKAAREALEKQENVGLVISVTETMTLPAEEIVTYLKQDISYIGLGTEHFEAMVTDTTDNGYRHLENQELYTGGKVYITSHGNHYLSEQTAEEYTERYLPVVLIDENLYRNCSYTTGEYSTQILFSDASAPEGWIPENATLIEASGSATVNTDGKLTKYTYDVTYALLGAEIRQEISVILGDPKISNVIEPSDMATYLSLPHPDVVKLTELSLYRIFAAKSITCSTMTQTVSEAAAVTFTDNRNIQTFDDGSFMAQLDLSREYTDLQTMESGGFTQKEVFRNNSYSMSVDGGPAKSDPTVDEEMMWNYVYDEIATGWIDSSSMTECEITNLGNILLLEFKGDNEIGKLIEDEICYELYEDESFLDSLASKYETLQMDFYIAIDTYLGLPAAAGFNYIGYHIIDGEKYPISREVTSSIYLASNDAYKAITGNPIPKTGDVESPTPLFYRVTGENGEEMWLLGTIHVGDGRTDKLPQEILDAFYGSDALALECNPDAMEEEIKDPAVAEEYGKAYYYSDGSTVKDHIKDVEMYEFALDLMKATGNYNAYAPYLKSPMWESAISSAWLQMSYTLASDKGVDNQLTQLAKSHKKPIREVESNLFQLKMLTGWSDALAENLLGGTLSTELHLYAADLMELYTMWCEGDEDALKEYMKEDTSELTPEEKLLWEEYNKAMATDRNKHMAEVAIQYLQSGDTVFYAVGLAHVIAEDGLVNALRDAGYTVELVTYN
jgi:uncharacterized protein YbaP (TraB family)